MPRDLEGLFAGLRADLANPDLAEPSEIRRLGTRRDHIRNLTIICATALAVVAALGTGVALADRPARGPVPPATSVAPRPTLTPSPSSSPSPSMAQPSTAPSQSPQGSPSRTAAGRASGAACLPADLRVTQPIRMGYAAGSTGHTVVVTNRSATPCRLSGYPVLQYTRPSGGTAKIPVTKIPPIVLSSPGPFELAPGEQASFIIFHVTGLGGYDPSSPACAHPVTYDGISIRFANGQRLALPGLTLEVECDGVRLQPWEPGVV